jgi:anti-sigma-K factor RskA
MQSTGPGHEIWEDATAAYLLGALEETERAAFEEHLADCPACREEVDELLPAAQALPIAVDPLAPPPSLKARIMADVHREAALLAAAGPEADRPSAPAARRRFSLPSWRLPRLVPAALAAVLLLVGVGIGVGVSQLGSGSERTITAQVAKTADAQRADAELEINGDEARLVARGLPAPPSGRVYQVWLKRDGHAPEATAALFKPSRDGTATASVPGSLDDVDQVMVTDEPDGGSQMPTGDLLLVAKLS